MLESNKEIVLTGEDALQILADIELVLISLHKMGSYYSDKPVEEYQKATTDFIDKEKVTQRLAQTRTILSRKFDSTRGADDMDDIERHLENLNFWKP